MTEIAETKPTIPTPPTPKINLEEIEAIIPIIRALVRAADGQAADDSPTLGFIETTDPRQTTIFENSGLEETHLAWDTSDQIGGKGNWLRMFKQLAASDLPLLKSIEGKNYVFTAAMVGKQQPNQQGQNINIGVPQWGNQNWSPQDPNQPQNPNGGPPQIKKKKRFGIF